MAGRDGPVSVARGQRCIRNRLLPGSGKEGGGPTRTKEASCLASETGPRPGAGSQANRPYRMGATGGGGPPARTAADRPGPTNTAFFFLPSLLAHSCGFPAGPESLGPPAAIRTPKHGPPSTQRWLSSGGLNHPAKQAALGPAKLLCLAGQWLKAIGGRPGWCPWVWTGLDLITCLISTGSGSGSFISALSMLAASPGGLRKQLKRPVVWPTSRHHLLVFCRCAPPTPQGHLQRASILIEVPECIGPPGCTGFRGTAACRKRPPSGRPPGTCTLILPGDADYDIFLYSLTHTHTHMVHTNTFTHTIRPRQRKMKKEKMEPTNGEYPPAGANTPPSSLLFSWQHDNR